MALLLIHFLRFLLFPVEQILFLLVPPPILLLFHLLPLGKSCDVSVLYVSTFLTFCGSVISNASLVLVLPVEKSNP